MTVKLPASITVLDDFDESVNMLVYGDSGVGKTVLAGTSPNALFLATEHGVISAKRQGSKAKVWKCDSWDDIEAAYRWLLSNPDHGFDWVVIDSLTEFQQHLLRWILDRAVKENASRDPDIPAIQDHQKWQNMYKRFVRQFNDLPVNMLYTATSFRKSDEEGDDLILPDILGKDYGMSQWTCASMHVVGYLARRKVKSKGSAEAVEVRRLLCEKTGPYFAKDRYDVLVPYVDSPNMPAIANRIGQPPVNRVAKTLPAAAGAARRRAPAKKAPAKKAVAAVKRGS